MPKVKPQFYAVRRGRKPGVYQSWDETKAQVNGYSGAAYQGFKTLAEAEAFVKGEILKVVVTPDPAEPKPSGPPAPRTEPANSVPMIASTSGSQMSEAKGLEEVIDGKTWRVVYTDGACSGNGRAGAQGGVGVYWGPGMKNVSERLPGAQTNNRAELIALIRALETDPDPTTPLILKTDSSYSIQCLRDWLPKWRKNGFKTKAGPVKNKEILLYLSSLMDSRPGHITMHHVRGHVGIVGNEMADRLAVAGASLPDAEERDWSVKEPEEDAPQSDGVDFEIPEDSLLSDQELLEMEQKQEFD